MIYALLLFAFLNQGLLLQLVESDFFGFFDIFAGLGQFLLYLQVPLLSRLQIHLIHQHYLFHAHMLTLGLPSLIRVHLFDRRIHRAIKDSRYLQRLLLDLPPRRTWPLGYILGGEALTRVIFQVGQEQGVGLRTGLDSREGKGVRGLTPVGLG